MATRSSRHALIGNLSFSVATLAGIVAVIVAGATIWLVLSDPVTVAESVDTGEVSPMIRSLANVLYDALVGLLKYL